MFYAARTLSKKYIPTVDPSRLFDEVVEATQSSLEGASLDPSELDEFPQLITLLDQNDPAFIAKQTIKPTVSTLIDLYIKRGDEETTNNNYNFDRDDVEEIESEAGKNDELSAVYAKFSRLSFLTEETSEQLKKYAYAFEHQSSELADQAKEIRENNPDHSDYDYHDYGSSTRSERFNISDIFSDL